ncbi:MAG: ATP-grasp domain-containing protein [Acidimicrobiales bacterium]
MSADIMAREPGLIQGRLAQIAALLGDRVLVWFGIRGDDAAPFLRIPQFRESFAITAPLLAGKLDTSVALEDITGRRVDLDAYDIDFDERREVQQFRARLLRSLARPSAVTTYRPSHFLSALSFGSRATSDHLGLFKDRQAAFEHKPWVETELNALGIQTIPWEYVPTEHRGSISQRLGNGPIILRPSRTSGGAGIEMVEADDEVETCWRDDSTHLMGVSPYFDDAVPINVGGCVFDGFEVTLHPCSMQLIGVASFTHRRFGYCGNDFVAVHQIDEAMLGEIDATSRAVGRWLATMGYRGAFGVDYLIVGDRLYFAEVNPRMQGSTRLSCALASKTDHLDICLDHLSAFLGLPPVESLTLADWRAEVPAAAQLIKHNVQRRPVEAGDARAELGLGSSTTVTLEPSPGVKVEPGGVLWRIEFDHQITTTGFDVIGLTPS